MGEGVMPREEGESLLRLPPVTVVQPPISRPPRDRANLLYIIMVIHGIGTLMPWNMFINAKNYFTDYKLVSHGNSTEDATLQEFRKNLMGYLTLSSQLPSVLCSFLNLFLQFGDGSLTPRIVGSLLVAVTMFVLTVILAMVDSTSWPVVFFYLTMVTVVILNMACGTYQNSIYGVAAKLPQKYSNAVVLGSNLCGTLIAVLNIVSIALSPNQRTAAVYYFVSALFILLVCLDTYFALPLLRSYRYYEKPITSSSTPRRRMPPYWFIFKKVWPQCLNVFLVFFVTLALFPGVASAIERYSKSFPIPVKYFTEVTCFLFFNLFALVGNIVPIWIRWPGPRFLWVPVVARLVFPPLFVACNYAPAKRVIPVYITNDWAYVAIMISFAFSSGYLSSLSMMYAPGTVPSDLAPVAGMMAAFFLLLGIFVGGNTVFLTTWLFTKN
ncbi:equilibrative nucleoside transporter 3-like isoform X1 [Ornithodoros turicata]